MSNNFDRYVKAGEKALAQLEAYRDVARRVKQVARQAWKGCRVYVFGSVLDKRYTAGSDIDILIVVDDVDREEASRVKAQILGTIDAPMELHVVSSLSLGGGTAGSLTSSRRSPEASHNSFMLLSPACCFLHNPGAQSRQACCRPVFDWTARTLRGREEHFRPAERWLLARPDSSSMWGKPWLPISSRDLPSPWLRASPVVGKVPLRPVAW